MQRAATGLATVCARLLGGGLRTPGRAARRHRQQRRRRAVRRRAPRPAGRPGRRRPARPGAGARRRARRAARAPADGCSRRRRRSPRVGRADLVLDGMLGIGGRGGLRPDAAELARPRRRGAGGDRRRRRPQRHRRRHRRGRGHRLPGHAHRHLRRGQARPGGGGGPRVRRARCTSSTSGSARTCRRPTAFRLTDADVAARLALPSAGDDKYSQGVVGIVAGSATYPGAGVLCTGAALRTRPGLVRYAGTAADGVRAAWPEAIVTDGRPADAGRVQAWVVGPRHGHRRRRPQRARRGAGHRSAGDRRRRRADDAGEGAGPGPRPDRGHRADAARPRVRAVRRPSRRRPGRRGPPAGRRAGLRRPAQGRRHRRGRTRRHGVRQRHGHPLAGHRRHRRRARPGSPARCWPPTCRPLEAGGGRRAPARPPGQLAAERGPLLAGTWSAACPRPSAGCAGVPGPGLGDSGA